MFVSASENINKVADVNDTETPSVASGRLPASALWGNDTKTPSVASGCLPARAVDMAAPWSMLSKLDRGIVYQETLSRLPCGTSKSAYLRVPHHMATSFCPPTPSAC